MSKLCAGRTHRKELWRQESLGEPRCGSDPVEQAGKKRLVGSETAVQFQQGCDKADAEPTLEESLTSENGPP